MKYGIIAALLVLSPIAFADNWSDNCSHATAPEMVLHYPQGQGQSFDADIASGKLSGTVREGTRCYKVGDVLTVTDAQGHGDYGKVAVEKVEFVKFDTITSDIAARDEQPNVAGVQNELVKIYGANVKTQPLTEIFFHHVQ